MKADCDSEADAVLIELEKVDQWDRGVLIDDAMYCDVAFRGDRAVAVSLRYPREELRLLDDAAERFEFDADVLRAATEAALGLPDREVTIEVGPRRLVGRAAKTL
ncbi:MAG TPA: hypothetical protein VHE08_03295 [Solirubrobacterales bacterium]|nr:hypothetical protein [Solirubrobacterales bacterium]